VPVYYLLFCLRRPPHWYNARRAFWVYACPARPTLNCLPTHGPIPERLRQLTYATAGWATYLLLVRRMPTTAPAHLAPTPPPPLHTPVPTGYRATATSHRYTHHTGCATPHRAHLLPHSPPFRRACHTPAHIPALVTPSHCPRRRTGPGEEDFGRIIHHISNVWAGQTTPPSICTKKAFPLHAFTPPLHPHATTTHHPHAHPAPKLPHLHIYLLPHSPSTSHAPTTPHPAPTPTHYPMPIPATPLPTAVCVPAPNRQFKLH